MEVLYNINAHKGEVREWTKGIFDPYDEHQCNENAKQRI